LILRIIIKIDATRCQILRQKCTKIVFGWAPPQNTLGELTALPQTPSLIKRGLLLREGIWEGRGRGGREGKRGEGKECEGGGGTGREDTPNILLHPQFQFF